MPSKLDPDGCIVPGTTWSVPTPPPPPPPRSTYAIFRQSRFAGWSLAASAELAIDLWIDTHDSAGVRPRSLPGPWEAIEKGEARARGLIR